MWGNYGVRLNSSTNKVFKLALKFYKKNCPFDTEKSGKIMNYLSTNGFQSAYFIAKSIDKNLPKYYNVKEFLTPKAYNKIQDTAKQYMSLLHVYYHIYLSTSINTLPDFQTSLMMLIYSFLMLFLKEDKGKGLKGGSLLERYFNKNRFLISYFKLTQVIRVLSQFSPLNRFIATELLQVAVIKGNFEYVTYLSRFDFKFDSGNLPDTLIKHFITKLTNPPYRNILEKFYNPNFASENMFENAISNAILSARIVKLPKAISGITLSNIIICLPSMAENNFANGVIFYILIHELAHYLQRVSVSSFKESCENKSDHMIEILEKSRMSSPLNDSSKPSLIPFQSIDDANIKEGGEYLEFLLFGGVKKRIYKSAAEYLFQTQEVSLEILKDTFLNYNKEGQQRNEDFYKIGQLETYYDEVFCISECGTKERIKFYKVFMNKK